MSDQNPILFYAGKRQLMPLVLNIAAAPVVLYILRIWPWPPTTIHLGAFLLTGIIAMRFYRMQLKFPKLVFDDVGIVTKTTFAAEEIIGVKPYMRALKVWVRIDEKEKEKVINLWWASKEDIQRIINIAAERYGLKE